MLAPKKTISQNPNKKNYTKRTSKNKGNSRIGVFPPPKPKKDGTKKMGVDTIRKGLPTKREKKRKANTQTSKSGHLYGRGLGPRPYDDSKVAEKCNQKEEVPGEIELLPTPNIYRRRENRAKKTGKVDVRQFRGEKKNLVKNKCKSFWGKKKK